MPHGTPDWGLVGPKATTYGLDDLGEHAVRLGSPVLWDRRGDVLVVTDFRDGLGEVYLTTVGIGGTSGLGTQFTRTGAYCVLMVGDGENEVTHTASVALPLPPTSGIGLEFSFNVSDTAQIWEARIEYWNRSRERQARVRYRVGPDDLQYDELVAGWTTFRTGVNLNPSVNISHTMKLVVDTFLDEYVRFTIDDLMDDLRGVSVADIGATTVAQLFAECVLTRPEDDTYDYRLDNMIVTQNEP